MHNHVFEMIRREGEGLDSIEEGKRIVQRANNYKYSASIVYYKVYYPCLAHNDDFSTFPLTFQTKSEQIWCHSKSAKLLKD